MTEILKNYWLYVLKLENNKYYIGITSKTPEYRFRQHVNGFAGAAWTKIHKPLSIHFTKNLGIVEKSRAEAYENKVVRKYLNKYGIDNVRGGDISMSEDLIIRFGWWWSKKDWAALSTVVLLLLVLFYLLIFTFVRTPVHNR